MIGFFLEEGNREFPGAYSARCAQSTNLVILRVYVNHAVIMAEEGHSVSLIKQVYETLHRQASGAQMLLSLFAEARFFAVFPTAFGGRASSSSQKSIPAI